MHGEGVGDGESLLGVVGVETRQAPLAGAIGHEGDGVEVVGDFAAGELLDVAGLERFDGRAQGVAHGETEDGAGVALQHGKSLSGWRGMRGG